MNAKTSVCQPDRSAFGPSTAWRPLFSCHPKFDGGGRMVRGMSALGNGRVLIANENQVKILSADFKADEGTKVTGFSINESL